MPSYLQASRVLDPFGSGRVQDIGVGQWIWALNLVHKNGAQQTKRMKT